MSWIVCKFKGVHGLGLCKYADKECNTAVCTVEDIAVEYMDSCPKGYDKSPQGGEPKVAA